MNNVGYIFQDIGYWFQANGLMDSILPFLLIFTLLFSLFERVKIFGDKKNINAILSFIFSLITVVPHVTRRYPPNYDPIVIINTLIPSAAVLAVVIVLVLFLLGIWGFEMGGGVPAFVILLILGILGYIFGTTIGVFDDPSSSFGNWWSSELTSLVIVILIFALIIWFITRDEKKTNAGFFGDWLSKRVK